MERLSLGLFILLLGELSCLDGVLFALYLLFLRLSLGIKLILNRLLLRFLYLSLGVLRVLLLLQLCISLGLLALIFGFLLKAFAFFLDPYLQVRPLLPLDLDHADFERFFNLVSYALLLELLLLLGLLEGIFHTIDNAIDIRLVVQGLLLLAGCPFGLGS